MLAVTGHPPWTGHVDDRNGVKIVVCSILFPFLATIFVGIRIFARTMRENLLGIDDYLILVSWGLVWILSVMAIFGWHYGQGRPAAEVPLYGIKKYVKGLYFFNLVYLVNFSICKLSILFFYKRIFSTSLIRRNIIVGMIYLTVTWTVAYEIAYIFQCKPISFFWHRLFEDNGTCVNRMALYASHATTNVLGDLMIYIFPMWALWNLQVSQMQKMGLLIIFAAGGFVVAISIARAAMITNIVKDDVMREQVYSSLFCTLEISFGCIVACLPAIRSVWIVYGRPLSLPKRSSGKAYDSDPKSPGIHGPSGGSRGSEPLRSPRPSIPELPSNQWKMSSWYEKQIGSFDHELRSDKAMETSNTISPGVP